MSSEFGQRAVLTGAVTLSFKDRFSNSPQFVSLFREGMALVEKTAEYLDRQGRTESRLLVPPASLVYTTESMKLTTRLMQLASWLLLRRAVTDGDVSEEEARNHKRRVRLSPQTVSQPDGFDDLPEAFRHLIAESHRLHGRVVRLDDLMTGDSAVQASQPQPPVVVHLDRIRSSFR